ncbi:MAG: helix-turn-helix transcriptional regulator [Gammaproteobacteria bacterium]|nr:helix-turn-helix transcriptional regulator [Gammaproteobacteria bacterium]
MDEDEKTNQLEIADDLVFKALAGSDRRRILDLLRDAPLTTGAICKKLHWLNRCTVMQHLGVLEKARLIIARKEGRQRWNYLDVSPIQRIHERWIQAYATPSAHLLSRWQQQIEG